MMESGAEFYIRAAFEKGAVFKGHRPRADDRKEEA